MAYRDELQSLLDEKTVLLYVFIHNENSIDLCAVEAQVMQH
jgi:hypothetical protein